MPQKYVPDESVTDLTNPDADPAEHGWPMTALVIVGTLFIGFVLAVILAIVLPPEQKLLGISGAFGTVVVFGGGILTLINSAEAARNSREAVRSSQRNTRRIATVRQDVTGQISVVHDALNGQLAALVKATGDAKLAEGRETGRDEGKAAAEVQAAAVAEALATVPVAAVPAPAPVVVIAPVANGATNAVAAPEGKDAVIVTGEDLHAEGPRGKP